MQLKNLVFTLTSAVILTNFFICSPCFAENNTGERGVLTDIAIIDKNEILLGVVASNKKVSSDVTDYAKLMIDEHGKNLTQILEMNHGSPDKPLSSNESNQLMAQGKKAMMKLGALQGDQFSKAYIDEMVKGHQAALNLIDKQLKTVKAEAIKTFLTDTRASVAHHLEQAKKLQQDMSA